EYRLREERLVQRAASGPVASAFAPSATGADTGFSAHVYRASVERTEFLALTLGDLSNGDVLVRVQTACLPGDVFGSVACDCGAQLRAAIGKIAHEGRGVVVWVYPAARQSLVADFEAHVLHRVEGAIARDQKLREFGLGAQVLADLGVRRIRLM